MRNTVSFVLLALCLCAWAAPSSAEAPGPLPGREKLTYRVSWLGIPVGTITASIKGITKVRGRDAYELEITADTNAFGSSVYPIHDRYVSFMDREKLCTLRHEVYRREGRYKKDAATDFDHASGKAYFRNFLDKSEKTIPIEAGIQDPVSIAYYFRTVEVALGERKEFRVYNNEDTYLLYAVADRKKKVRTPALGLTEAFHIQPYAMLQGRLVKKGKASMYITGGGRRIPVIGSVRAPLFTEIKGYLESVE